VGRVAARALRRWRLDQGAGAADGVEPQHDQGGAAVVGAAELSARAFRVGGKTIVDDCLREVRPSFETARSYQRTVCRPGEICQFDVWEPNAEIPVGHGQTRTGWVVVACLGYSRAGAGAITLRPAPRAVQAADAIDVGGFRLSQVFVAKCRRACASRPWVAAAPARSRSPS
jgi:hypothetical protein